MCDPADTRVHDRYEDMRRRQRPRLSSIGALDGETGHAGYQESTTATVPTTKRRFFDPPETQTQPVDKKISITTETEDHGTTNQIYPMIRVESIVDIPRIKDIDKIPDGTLIYARKEKRMICIKQDM